MSTVIVAPGDLVLQDPADSRVYRFNWDDLAAAVTLASSTFSITGINPLGLTLNLAVTSLVYVDPTLTITTAVPHGYSTNDFITLAGVTPVEMNVTLNVTVVTPTTFTMSFSGYPPPTGVPGATATKGLDLVSVLTAAPYNSRWSQFRFTANGVRNGMVEIANRIVTSETPSQVIERSFRILLQDL